MSAALEEQIDRLSELANIGAGRAAGAFSQLTGQAIRMAVPHVRLLGVHLDTGTGAFLHQELDEEEPAGSEWTSGVIFEFDGCLNAVMAVLFRREMCDAIVRKLVGQTEGALPPETVEGVLMEVGNVLASHVASAIADTLGARLLPSIPMLALEAAFEQLEGVVAARPDAGELWIESELVDSDGNLGGLVVLIPDRETL